MTTPEGPSRRGTLILAIVAGGLVLLVVIGAILVFVVGGDDKGSSTTAQTGATTSRSAPATTTSGTSTSATNTTSTTTGASSSAAARVLVDGKDQGVEGSVKCNSEGGTLTINIGVNVFVELTDADPPKVNEVGLGSVEGVVLGYDADGDGDATVTRNGKTYKVTGHATGFDITDPFEGLQSKEFEIEATCP
jgi:lipoprotein LpqH